MHNELLDLAAKQEDLLEQLQSNSEKFRDVAQSHVEMLANMRASVGAVAEEMPKASANGVKRGRKPGRKPAEKPEKDSKQPGGLEKIILGILAKNKSGLEVSQITDHVQDMIDKGAYTSKAKNLATVVSQAVHKLKKKKLISKNDGSKRYLLAA